MENISPTGYQGQWQVSGAAFSNNPLLLSAPAPGNLANQKMQRRLADTQLIATIKHARLPGCKPHRIIDHGAVHRSEILNEKRFALEPDARVAPRHLCLRIEARKIDLRKDVRMRIGASK